MATGRRAARELEERVATRTAELARNVSRRQELHDTIERSERQLDEDVRTFDELREHVRAADEASQALRSEFESQESTIRDARKSLEGVRDEASQLEVERATAESDLAHLASSCADSVQATLDEVAAEVDQMERDGLLASPKAVEDAPEPAEIEPELAAEAGISRPDSDERAAEVASSAAASSRTLTPGRRRWSTSTKAWLATIRNRTR